MMDLESAIQHCKEQVQEQAKRGCYSCAEEHQQLAEWLKELKTSRECIERIRIACLCPGLRGDGFEDEIVNAMNEYLYDMGKEWEE